MAGTRARAGTRPPAGPTDPATPVPAPAKPKPDKAAAAAAGAGDPTTSQPGGVSISLPQSGPVHQGAGFVLALMLWSWVVLPFFDGGGVAGVKKTFMAKFLNRKPDGSFL